MRAKSTVLVGILLLALNLRPAAVAVGPVLLEVSAALRMSPFLTGVLTSLPSVAFATFGAAAPWMARRIGIHTLACLAAGCTALGLALRVSVDSSAPFLAFSMLALAGMAAGNVLMPSLVRLHFPLRVGRITALYSTSMAIGLTLAASTTAPLTESSMGWRFGLGIWALLAAVAVLPWLLLIRRDRKPGTPAHRLGLLDIARTRLGQAMVVLFALQSMQAYVLFGWLPQLLRDAGYSGVNAGLLMGVATGLSIPLSLVAPVIATRFEGSAAPIVTVASGFPVSYLLLLIDPHALAIPAVLLISMGFTTFPLVLTLIGTKARTAEGTASLSALTQSGGYALSAASPLAIGTLYHLTGGWQLPLLIMLATCLPLVFLGISVTRSRPLEDLLHR